MIEAFVAASLIGLLGVGHCLGMCGGISAALSFALPAERANQKLIILCFYNVGRIGSYVLIGVFAGALGYGIEHNASQVSSFPFLRVLAGLLLVLMGLYVAGWWRVLTVLEKGGASLWRIVQPLGKSLMPVSNIWQALILGGLWGWLPCGLVYTALSYALAQGSVSGASMVMLGFGIGTLPALLVGGLAGERLKSFLIRPALRNASAILLILFGVWTWFGAFQHQGHEHHSDSESAEGESLHHHHSHH